MRAIRYRAERRTRADVLSTAVATDLHQVVLNYFPRNGLGPGEAGDTAVCRPAVRGGERRITSGATCWTVDWSITGMLNAAFQSTAMA